jgi:hypothetical protein
MGFFLQELPCEMLKRRQELHLLDDQIAELVHDRHAQEKNHKGI